MPRKYQITFADSAVQDLEAIRRWYADQELSEVGERVVEKIVSAVERLADFPMSGRIVPEFGIAHLREIVLPPFRIVYRIDKRGVRVVRIRRSERSFKMP
ncbi:MAG: type II toxin-antitoxin system RelE/ParE family toxin [Desulfomonilaceae bacterium]|nr:type II toxin-antitoxin system RelE/ParE family toxin [Desulfomonilaceae bacterium]